MTKVRKRINNRCQTSCFNNLPLIKCKHESKASLSAPWWLKRPAIGSARQAPLLKQLAGAVATRSGEDAAPVHASLLQELSIVVRSFGLAPPLRAVANCQPHDAADAAVQPYRSVVGATAFPSYVESN